MAGVKYLSYILEDKVPGYGNANVDLEVNPRKSLKKGDSCNTYGFCMENHWGTHVDAPAHFFPQAKKVSDYSPENWIFKKPCVVELAPDKGHIISVDELRGKADGTCDILLIKTGFYRLRGEEVYSFDNPVVSPEVGLWLRAEMPSVRAIGFDFISIGSCGKRDLARETHRAFLDPEAEGNPVLIIEDMDLSEDLSGLAAVFVAPLMIKRLDSAPCTVFGLFKINREVKI